MRKLRGLSCPQAAARARVTLADIQAAESGRAINAGALLRLLQVYEPGEAPGAVVPTVVLRAGPRRGGGDGAALPPVTRWRFGQSSPSVGR